MNVSGLASLVDPAERVMSEIEAWWPRFMRGELRPPISGRPGLAPEERFAVDVGRVRAAGLGHPAAGGVLCATDRRALVFDVGLEPVRAWGLTELASVSALGNWRGLAIVHPAGDTELVVAVESSPPTWRDAAGWLKVECAFAAARGRLAEWVVELPDRLTAAGHGNQWTAVEGLVRGDLGLVVRKVGAIDLRVIVAGSHPHASPYLAHRRSREPITARSSMSTSSARMGRRWWPDESSTRSGCIKPSGSQDTPPR